MKMSDDINEMEFGCGLCRERRSRRCGICPYKRNKTQQLHFQTSANANFDLLGFVSEKLKGLSVNQKKKYLIKKKEQ